METSVALIAGLLGLAIGSFVNVIAYRVPLGKSVVAPPSACPRCDAPIRPKDNVPVVSWLVLRGRCRDCGERISLRYPVVEAFTGLAFAGTVVVIGVNWALPAYLFFVAVSIALSLTDIDHKRIPNRILYPSVPIGVALLAVGAFGEGGWQDFGRALAGAALYFGWWLLVAIITRGGFGMGDVKLAFFLGLFTTFISWRVLVVSAFAGVLIGGLISLVLLLSGRKSRRDQVPFGPSLIAGAWVAIVWGAEIVDFWMSIGE